MRILHSLRSVAVILLVTLCLDFAVTLFIPAQFLDSWLAARDRDAYIYDRNVAWHHEIRPNIETNRLWGQDTYLFKSDALGFRQGECAANNPAAEKDNTVFVVGDSFTEGLGLPFEQSFAGLLACAYRERGMAARNLGTSIYSPIIYHRKIEAAARRLDIKPREIVLFLDISDIHNDAVDYVEIDGRVYSERPTTTRRVKDFLKHNFASFGVLFELNQRLLVQHATPITVQGNELALWTVNKTLYESWGRRGLETASANLDKVVSQCAEWNCRITLVVYPWPDQIATGDRDSMQVRYWKDWSARNGVRFVDAFGSFFEGPAEEAIRQNYIPGDVHFNAAGSRAIFDTVWKVLAGDRASLE